MTIFDSSTLILIAKIELLDLLLAKGMKFGIPPEVEEECCSETGRFDALLIRKRIEEQQIRVLKVRTNKAVRRMEVDFDLGAGEAAAIALALQEHAESIAIDDKLGINACKVLRMPFITALALLVRTKEHGWLLPAVSVGKLEQLKVFGRYSRAIIDDARKRLEV